MLLFMVVVLMLLKGGPLIVPHPNWSLDPPTIYCQNHSNPTSTSSTRQNSPYMTAQSRASMGHNHHKGRLFGKQQQ
jgi:hypothetical protein